MTLLNYSIPLSQEVSGLEISGRKASHGVTDDLKSDRRITVPTEKQMPNPTVEGIFFSFTIEVWIKTNPELT